MGGNAKNIAKGTTDPRVEFLSQVQNQILVEDASKSAANCCQHDPHQQQLQHQQVLSWHLHTPGSHQSCLLNRSQLVSELVTRVNNDRTRVR